MAGVAQLVRASGCGSEGRGFETRHSPHILGLLPSLRRAKRRGNLVQKRPEIATLLLVTRNDIFFLWISNFYID